MVKKKKPLHPPRGTGGEIPENGEEKEGSWWRKSDAELVADRYRHIRTSVEDRKMKVDDEDRAPLIKEAVKRDPNLINILDLVPLRRKGMDRDGEYLLLPMYSTGRGEKIAGALRLKTKRRIRLDEYGLSVWELVNNKRDIRQIGSILRKRFGDEVEPLYPRLSKFIAYLESLKIVKLKR